MEKKTALLRFLEWRAKHIGERSYMMMIAVVIGIFAGIAAVILRNSVHWIESFLTAHLEASHENPAYFALPALGILITVLFVKYILKDKVGHGVPSILYAISKNNGIIKRHNIFSSILTSAITVGFGGSAGLEGPSIATGGAIGSNLGQVLRLNYKQLVLCLTLACAGAMAAIFKSPIAAVVFSVEVLMIDLTLTSIVPLLISSATAVLVSYSVLGSAVLYPLDLEPAFYMRHMPYYLLLGVVSGLVSVYFTRTYIGIEALFKKVTKWWIRWAMGGTLLGLIIFFFPSIYGEGYKAINVLLQGDISVIYNGSPFYAFKDNFTVIILIFIALIVFKVIATSLTFGAGGIGGVFAPTLVVGGFTGMLFCTFLNNLIASDLPSATFTMVAMGGLMSGVMHAPLTGIFMIAEITGGYELLIPLMIVSVISYATVRIFVTNSIHTYLLALRGELITHHKDKAVLSMLHMEELIEKDFMKIHPDAKLGDLVKVISESSRNIYPVVDNENNFLGFIRLDDIRHIIFRQELYDTTSVTSLMTTPATFVEPDDSMEVVAQKFQEYDKYNLPVLDNGKYVGFVSRANVFLSYRKLLKDISDD